MPDDVIQVHDDLVELGAWRSVKSRQPLTLGPSKQLKIRCIMYDQMSLQDKDTDEECYEVFPTECPLWGMYQPLWLTIEYNRESRAIVSRRLWCPGFNTAHLKTLTKI